MNADINIILPENYTSEKLIKMYQEADEKVNRKAVNAKQHFSGFSLAYTTVTCILCILNLFVKEGPIATMHDFLICDNFLVWLIGFEYIVFVDKIFSFLCKKCKIAIENPYDTRDFLHLLGMCIFAERWKECPSRQPRDIEYTIPLDDYNMTYHMQMLPNIEKLPEELHDFRWIDAEIDKYLKKHRLI